jgi:hypothetical protein
MSIVFRKAHTTEDRLHSTPNQLYVTIIEKADFQSPGAINVKASSEMLINLPKSLIYKSENGAHSYKDASGNLEISIDFDFTTLSINLYGTKIDLQFANLEEFKKIKESLDTLIVAPEAAHARSTEFSRRGGLYAKYLKYKGKYLSLKKLL